MGRLIVSFVPDLTEEGLQGYFRIGHMQLIRSQLSHSIEGEQSVAFRREGHGADGRVAGRECEPRLFSSRMVQEDLALRIRRHKPLDALRGGKGRHS